MIAIYNEHKDKLENDLEEISTALTCIVSIKDYHEEMITQAVFKVTPPILDLRTFSAPEPSASCRWCKAGRTFWACTRTASQSQFQLGIEASVSGISLKLKKYCTSGLQKKG